MAKRLKSVYDLRQQGFKVRVKHRRQSQPTFDRKGRPVYQEPMSLYEFAALRGQEPGEVRSAFFKQVQECGGETVLEVLTPEGEALEVSALCSKKDNYNKKRGVRIALGRLMAELAE